MLSALRRTIQKIPVAMKMEDSPVAFTAILKITRLYRSCIQNHPSSQTKGDHYIITSFKALNCSNGLFFVQSNLQLKTMS